MYGTQFHIMGQLPFGPGVDPVPIPPPPPRPRGESYTTPPSYAPRINPLEALEIDRARRTFDALFRVTTTEGLQRALQALGFDPGPIDDDYGPRTTAAVASFQRAASLPPNGFADARTLLAIQTALRTAQGRVSGRIGQLPFGPGSTADPIEPGLPLPARPTPPYDTSPRPSPDVIRESSRQPSYTTPPSYASRAARALRRTVTIAHPGANAYASPGGRGIGAFAGGTQVTVFERTFFYDPAVPTAEPQFYPSGSNWWRVQGIDVGQRLLMGWIRVEDIATGSSSLSQTSGYAYATVGFTSPTFTYTKMRAMQAHAEQLDTLIEAYVPNNDFRSSWKDWYDHAWRPFFDKYANPSTSSSWAKLGAGFDSDTLAAQAESFRRQLEQYDRDYRGQRTIQNQPVPTPVGIVPPHVEPGVTDRQFTTSFVPWWGWALGAVGVAGLGAYAYHRFTRRGRR